VRQIKLTKGQIALVDDDDFYELNKFKWYAHWITSGRGRFYAIRNSTADQRGMSKKVLMHRQIMATGHGLEVDHINHDGLDNRKINLRNVTHSQNLMNRDGLCKNSTSGVRGVRWHKMSYCRGGWTAEITVGGIKHYLGRFGRKQDAAAAYSAASRRYFGEFGS